ncbi:hypothetical protein CAP36_13695 [Chitinophagaceae bacterium IBVUCB2]|nr:hypothetical protein CAP36_13695 [Chitinophagaceae bacterium IBVUCB2]
MQVRFVKMIQFSRQFKAGDRQREFNFRKLSSPETGAFSVNVSDERGNRILFTMEKIEGEWKITSAQLPQWILSSEKNLHGVIEDELAKNDEYQSRL